MRVLLSKLPFGAWAGLVLIGLGAWAKDLFGVILGGILAVVTLIMTDQQKAKQDDSSADDITKDERFKDL